MRCLGGWKGWCKDENLFLKSLPSAAHTSPYMSLPVALRHISTHMICATQLHICKHHMCGKQLCICNVYISNTKTRKASPGCTFRCIRHCPHNSMNDGEQWYCQSPYIIIFMLLMCFDGEVRETVPVLWCISTLGGINHR